MYQEQGFWGLRNICLPWLSKVSNCCPGRLVHTHASIEFCPLGDWQVNVWKAQHLRWREEKQKLYLWGKGLPSVLYTTMHLQTRPYLFLETTQIHHFRALFMTLYFRSQLQNRQLLCMRETATRNFSCAHHNGIPVAPSVLLLKALWFRGREESSNFSEPQVLRQWRLQLMHLRIPFPHKFPVWLRVNHLRTDYLLFHCVLGKFPQLFLSQELTSADLSLNPALLPWGSRRDLPKCNNGARSEPEERSKHRSAWWEESLKDCRCISTTTHSPPQGLAWFLWPSQRCFLLSHDTES